MDRQIAVATLKSLGLGEPIQAVDAIEDGSTSLLRSESGSSVALLRRGEKYDTLILGAYSDCPVPSLRAVLETAVLPLSDNYAANIGVAVPERDAVRKRIREASVALDVIAKGRNYSVPPPDIPLHPSISEHVQSGHTSVDHLADDLVNDLALLNKLQSTVMVWSRETDRIVQLSSTGPEGLLSVEEETVFWSSLDGALSTAQQRFAGPSVRLTLDILARGRRATGFLIDAENSLDAARRRASGVLSLIQGLPVVSLRTAEDLSSLREAVVGLLEHVSAKLRITSFSIERVLSLVDSMGTEVSRSIGRILSGKGGILVIPFEHFVETFQSCCSLFEAWAQGFDHCRKVARESARAKGEAMPSRGKSPLSHVHQHLSDVYGLRSDHQDLRALFLDLTAVVPGSKKSLAKLDSAYAILVESCEGFDHFQVFPSEQSNWKQLSSTYRHGISSIEKSAAFLYEEFVNTGRSLDDLSGSLRPFERMLEKSFLTAVVTDAISFTLKLGRRDFSILQSREITLKNGSFSNRAEPIAVISRVLLECRLVQARAAVLVSNIERIVGKTQINVSSELRNFVADVGQLQQRVAPSSYFARWLDSVSFERGNGELFIVNEVAVGPPYIHTNLDSQVASFFKVFRVTKRDPQLEEFLGPQHNELAHLSKEWYPSYCNFGEALQSFNSSCYQLWNLEECQFDRVYSFVSAKRNRAQMLLEEGLEKSWNDSCHSLLSYSIELRAGCQDFEVSLQSLLEKDGLLEDAVRDLNRLHPSFLNGRLSVDTKDQLVRGVKRFLIGLMSLRRTFGSQEGENYVTEHWLPRFTSTLCQFLDRLTSTWVTALKSRNLTVPMVVIERSKHAMMNHEICCTPGLFEMELILYKNVGDVYAYFVDAVNEVARGAEGEGSQSGIVAANEILAYFLANPERMKEQQNFEGPSKIIALTLEHLRQKIGTWSTYGRKADSILLAEHEVVNIQTCDIGRYIEDVAVTYSEVLSLRQDDEFDKGSKSRSSDSSFVSTDTSSLFEEISSKLLTSLRQRCLHVSSKAADLSQDIYRKLSFSKNSIADSSNYDGTEALVLLQTVKEELLPSSKLSVQWLLEFEHMLERVASLVDDVSLSPTKIAGTWILSEELVAHLSGLHSLLERRSQSVLVNRVALLSKYEEDKGNHHQSLSAAFSKFEEIRNDTSQDRDLFGSTSALDDIERQLEGLGLQALCLERTGRALGADLISERNGTQNMIAELRKVRVGIEKLCCVEEKVSLLSKEKVRNVEPAKVQRSLGEWARDVSDIADLSGARREANYLKDKLNSHMQVNGFLKGLHSVRLSVPRERDLMQKLFGETYPKAGVAGITLDMFWHADISAHAQYLRGVFENAAGELAISEFLKGIAQTWSGRKCTFAVHGNSVVLQGITKILDELDEDLQGLETLGSSQHARLFESERTVWEQRLLKCHEDLELFSDVQSTWAHLKTLFGSSRSSGISGLRTDLQAEFTAFSNVHARFTSLGTRMKRASGLLEGLDAQLGLGEMKSELDGIVRSLSSFLEKQRSLFPRFFFLSDNDLLHVLSISSADVDGLMPHLSKIYPGASRFQFSIEKHRSLISSVVSKEGEVLPLKPVSISSDERISSWLVRLEMEIVNSLKRTLPPAIHLLEVRYRAGAIDIPEKFMISYMRLPSQIALLAVKVCFARAIEKCLDSTSSARRLEELSSAIDLNLGIVCSCKQLSEADNVPRRKFIMARDQLLKEFVYQRDIVALFRGQDVSDILSHLWQHELRFYCARSAQPANVDEMVVLRCGKAEFNYGWEYLGVGESLVQTALTSRCFLNLSEALRRGLGGSPFGPAGTGKTETVKALGRLMGRFVAVFNCDESFDSISVGRILAGACRIGSWVCFDEFNRLSASILSTTSGQLAAVQAAIKRCDPAVENFYSGDLPVTLNRGIGVFVTTNPKYSGRRALPANLKTLFRPCAMPKPDSAIIVEVLLLSQGFKSSGVLARQLVTLFHHLHSSLCSRPHYDFGLRSLKSTVLAAGTLLDGSKKESNVASLEVQEEDLIIRALGQVLKPKFEGGDVRAYRSAISTTFTMASCLVPVLSMEIESIMNEVMMERNLYRDTVLLDKVRELYSLLEHQSGVILVGPTASGKSVTWRTLYEVLRRLSSATGSNHASEKRRQVKSSLTLLDAKLLSSKQLFGELDTVTREWSDGLFTTVLRRLYETSSKDESSDDAGFHWIVFDGDVDPDWVESLNSVLDDNRILTLPNGEQIPLLANTRILFETDCLENANPSTVSRCGMVCFTSISFSTAVDVFTSSAANIVSEVCSECQLPKCFKEMLLSTLELSQELVENQHLVMKVPLWSLLGSVLRLFRVSLLRCVTSLKNIDERQNGMESDSAMSSMSRSTLLHILLITSVQGIGAGLPHSLQSDISKALLKKIGNLREVQDALVAFCDAPNLAELSLSADGTCKSFGDFVSTHDGDISSEDIASPDIVISTVTTVRLEYLIRESLNVKEMDWRKIHPLILCGPPGCGKSMMIAAALRDVPNLSVASLSFSSETSSESILAALRGHTEISKRGNGCYVLHPKVAGYRVVLFCDEVNLQKPDLYGTQSSIEFLRSLAEHNGFWHGSPGNWVTVEGLQVVAACNPEEDAGRHSISHRFLKSCHVVRVELPTSDDLKIIYGAFVQALLSKVHHDLVSKASTVTSAMVEFFTENRKRFSPDQRGPLQSHYIYSPRELSRWIRGMKLLLNVDSRKSQTVLGGSVAYSQRMWDLVISAFSYEARRIFCDRLLSEDDRLYAEARLSDVVAKHLQVGYETDVLELYSSWLSTASGHGKRPRFESISDATKFRDLIYQRLRVFAEEEGLGGSWMSGTTSDVITDASGMIDQFAVTDDVLTHLTRIERILSQSLGHAVLMGAPGTGKKTLARFAAWMLSMQVYQIHSHASYTEDDFADDLRGILRRAGVDGRQIMMIFDESNALESSFLEMMNSILACGEVPGLYSGEERVRLLEDLRTSGANNATSTEHALYEKFVKRVRNNLHIVFTISTGCVRLPSCGQNGNLRAGGDISQRSPALYNRCTVDWIGDWTKQTLEAVADLKIEVALGAEKDQIIGSAVEIHGIAKRCFRRFEIPLDVTPRHYLEFIEQINRLALEKGNAIQLGADRHTEGLRRLEMAGIAVDDVKDALNEKSDNLQGKEVLANETLERMVEEQRRAEKAKVDAEDLAMAAEEASIRVREREDEVAAQLAEVQPKVEAARAAVSSIRKEFLDELRAMPNPPTGVRIALEGVIMVLDGPSQKPDGRYSWGSIRARMRGSEFIASVANFDADSVSSRLRARLEKQIIGNPDFDVDRILYASRAAGPLAQWTLSVLDYAAVKDGVEPLEAEVRDLQEEQEELLTQQETAVRDVALLQDRIQQCRSTYTSLISESERIRQDIQESEKNLLRAEEMLASLGEEFKRWVKELNGFNYAAVNLWGNAVYGAAFIAYAGTMDHMSRSFVTREWRNVLIREGIRFNQKLPIGEFLTSPEERGVWSARNLPTDASSLENYAILKRSARFPLLIDPSRGSPELLRKVLGLPSGAQEHSANGQDLRISQSSFAVTTGKKSYMRSLESAMRFGTAIVLEDADKFDRAVAPLLGQESSYGDASEILESGSSIPNNGQHPKQDSRANDICRRVVRLGDRDVFLSSRFRLYLSAVDVRHVPTSAVTRSNVVSFELSPAALKSSCIAKAMHIILPDLESRRKSLLSAKVQYEKRKRILEENVLSAITDVEDLQTEILGGSLLDNLSNLKKEVGTLEARQKEELRASDEIRQAQSTLRPIGETASTAFTVLQSLTLLCPFYVFHASFFLRVFESAVSECKETIDGDRECPVLEYQNLVLRRTYSDVAASLFPRDRVPFAASLVLASGLDSDNDNISERAVEDIVMIQNSILDVIRVSGRSIRGATERGSVERKLPIRVQEVISIAQNTDNALFSPLSAAIHILQSILYARESLPKSVDDLACALPGEKDVVHGRGVDSEPTLVKVLTRAAQSSRRDRRTADRLFAPLFLYTRGEASDPSSRAFELAHQLGIPVISIAMGSTHTPASVEDEVSQAVETAAETGLSMLLFKNMHLATPQTCEALQAEIMKRGGLLPCVIIIVAEAAVLPPPSLIGFTSFSQKLAFEMPASFPATFRASFGKIQARREQEALHWPYPNLDLDRLHVSFAWLHSTILERSLNAPVGFSMSYEFSDSDLFGAWDIVTSRASKVTGEQTYLESVHDMLISAIYGCRLENDADVDILKSLVQDVLSWRRLNGRSGLLNVAENVSVPTNRDRIDDYFRAMPNEAPPAWSRMPSTSSKKRQAREGIQSLEKVLQLSQSKFDIFSDNNVDGSIDRGDQKKNLRSYGRLSEILKLGADICEKRPDRFEAGEGNAWSSFLETESTVLGEIFEVVQSDISQLQLGRSTALKPGSRLMNLKDELEKIISSDYESIPDSWFEVCNHFGRCIPIETFFSKLQASVSAFENLISCGTRVIDISAILRPQALFEALKFEESARRGISPHSLELYITGENDECESSVLAGVYLNGMVWDRKKQVFTRNALISSSIAKLAFHWILMGRDESNMESIYVPLYGRGEKTETLLSSRIPVETETSVAEWRLCSASLSLEIR